MKKFLAVVVAVFFIAALGACADNDQQDPMPSPDVGDESAPSINEPLPEPEHEPLPEPEPTEEPSSSDDSREPTYTFTERLVFAYGLFSIGTPETFEEAMRFFAMEGYATYDEEEIIIDSITANYAPKYLYDLDAYPMFTSGISYIFAVHMGGSMTDYEETEPVTEKLSEDAEVTWSIMSAPGVKCLMFEVFTLYFGYNVIIHMRGDIDDQLLLDMMYSFDYDVNIENRIVNQIQGSTSDGVFFGLDNSLRVSLSEDYWKVDPDFLSYGSVFALERNNAEQMILLRRLPRAMASAEHPLEVFEPHIEHIMQNVPERSFGEITSIQLPGLGVEAFIVESEGEVPDGNIVAQDILFFYKQDIYIGRFMWMEHTNMRTEIENAILSLAPAW